MPIFTLILISQCLGFWTYFYLSKQDALFPNSKNGCDGVCLLLVSATGLIRPDTRRFAYQLLAWTYKYELREQSFLKYLPPSARLVVCLRLK